jgi:magnesium-transporting ATPase (P-type)
LIIRLNLKKDGSSNICSLPVLGSSCFTNFVPISLLVSLDLVKLYQGFFMSWDVIMYDDEEDMAMRAQAINLNEELG